MSFIFVNKYYKPVSKVISCRFYSRLLIKESTRPSIFKYQAYLFSTSVEKDKEEKKKKLRFDGNNFNFRMLFTFDFYVFLIIYFFYLIENVYIQIIL